MFRSRKTGWLIAIGSLAVGIVSVLVMSARVREYNAAAHFAHFRFDVATDRHFEAYGRQVQIDDAEEDGRAVLRVQYGDLVKTVRVTPPPAKGIPDLGIYGDWAKVVGVHELERTPDGKQQDKPGTGRLVLLTRLAPEGYDPQTWGSVRRGDWTFEFHEFKADGTIVDSTFRWPRSRLGESGLKKEIEKGDEGAKALSKIEPLKERSWEYNAAMHVIPKLNVPQYRFNDTAMRAMGWTLPVAGFSVLGVMVGLGIALAPRRGAEKGAATGSV